MTLSTSLVAVWYSSDSCSSRLLACSASNSRVFSMAITAWSAKVLANSVWRSLDGFAHADQGHGQICAQTMAPSNITTLWILVGFGLHIGELNRLPFKNGSSGENPTRQGQRAGYWNGTMVGDEWKQIAVHLMDRHIICIAEAGRARCNVSEHPLQVSRRA